MNEFLHYGFAGSTGVITGLIFFGGLWFTTQRIPVWKYPALWLPLSFFVRMSIALGAFYWVGKDSLPGMAACLAGFLIGRMLVFSMTRAKDDREEADHAPQP
jgi:F1F0 ATPase subunit 2